MVIFHSFLYVYQRVYPNQIPLNHHKSIKITRPGNPLTNYDSQHHVISERPGWFGALEVNFALQVLPDGSTQVKGEPCLELEGYPLVI